ncbi:MAG: HVO_A0114 family putative DNA-binding protein [Thiobacillus sp.]
MKTVTLDIRSPSNAMTDFVQAWKTGKSQRSARISFATPELLWKVLTAKRWELLKTMCGAGPMSIREAARRAGRDVKAVHGDVTALLEAGVLSRSSDGKVEFPYDVVKVEFMLQAA